MVNYPGGHKISIVPSFAFCPSCKLCRACVAEMGLRDKKGSKEEEKEVEYAARKNKDRMMYVCVLRCVVFDRIKKDKKCR